MIEKKIKAFMNRKGINYSKAARSIGLTPYQFSSSMNGRRKMKADEFMALCAFLEVKAEEIDAEPIQEERSA